MDTFSIFYYLCSIIVVIFTYRLHTLNATSILGQISYTKCEKNYYETEVVYLLHIMQEIKKLNNMHIIQRLKNLTTFKKNNFFLLKSLFLLIWFVIDYERKFNSVLIPFDIGPCSIFYKILYIILMLNSKSFKFWSEV